MKILTLFSITIVLLFCVSGKAQEWRDVAPSDTVILPKDLYVQNGYRTQWWYFTGHLYDGQGREFGYELTFFIVGVQKKNYESKFGVDTIYLSNFAISDIQGKKFYNFSDADSGAYGFAGADSSKLRVWIDRDKLEGSLDKMRLTAHANGVSLNLVLLPKKPFVLHGDRGYSRKSEESPLIASLYFSCTDLEISSKGLPENEAGWDWFALQLDDGQEIMLYVIRKTDGAIDRYSSGTLVDAEGKVIHLANEDYHIEVMNSYLSKKTDSRYPSKWEIAIPREKLHFIVTPLLEDQEFAGGLMRGNAYWEGTCKIEGSAKGRAYVEMTGYEKH
jgi:predicted secreted hydrolase